MSAVTEKLSYSTHRLETAWGVSGLAYGLSGQRAVARTLERWGQWLLPWVMIAVGLYILSDTATDTLL